MGRNTENTRSSASRWTMLAMMSTTAATSICWGVPTAEERARADAVAQARADAAAAAQSLVSNDGDDSGSESPPDPVPPEDYHG